MVSQSAVALGIAMLGVYGVVAYFVSSARASSASAGARRTPVRIVKLVVEHTIHILLIGLLPGVLIASLSSG